MVRRPLLLLALLLPTSVTSAGTLGDVDEPENLPPPKEAQVDDDAVAAAAADVPASYRKSVTLEASVGVGGVFSNLTGVNSGVGLSGINFGIGGFLNPKLAFTGRFMAVLTGGSNNVSQMFLGGAAQYWLDDKLWVGAGAGLAYAYANTNTNGFGLEARAGYTFKQTRAHAFHASIEATPALFDGNLLFAIAALVGYQYL